MEPLFYSITRSVDTSHFTILFFRARTLMGVKVDVMDCIKCNCYIILTPMNSAHCWEAFEECNTDHHPIT
jgi:hypothetical protein